jgi:hypothetical protein
MLITFRLFHLFVGKVSEFEFLQTSPEQGSTAVDNSSIQIYKDEDDLDQCLYYLRTLSNVLRWSSDNMWAILSRTVISTDPTHVSLHRISKYLLFVRVNIF